MRTIIERDYDSYKMVSRELIGAAITPWSKRVALTANRLIHFARSAISCVQVSDYGDMASLKDAIRFYSQALVELL